MNTLDLGRMRDRSIPPFDPDLPPGSPPPDRGWRSVGPGQIERRLHLEDEETRELFLALMDRVADLSGLVGRFGSTRTARVQAARMTLEGERAAAGTARPLELVLRLRLEVSDG